MQTYELSRTDFEALDKAFEIAMRNERSIMQPRMEQLRDKFRAAHTAHIETEE